MPTLSATILITTIPNMATSTSFQVTGTTTYNPPTWTDQLVYVDDHGNQVPIASPSINLGASSWSFTHAPMAVGTHTISVKDPLTGTVAISNAFTVGAAAPTIVANTPTGAVAGSSFFFSGTLSSFSVAPSLTYKLNGGSPVPLTGVTLTGWNTPITIPASGTYTLVVTNGSVSSNTVTFTVAPVTVNHTITPNPPVAQAGPNYIFYDTFTSLADITDTGGQPLAGVKIIQVGSGLTFTDGTGGVWSITPAGVAQLNGANAGFSANVIELVLINNVVWQENASNQWYSWSPPSTWNPGANPLAGGTNGSWMNHYAFGGSEFTLSANGELEYYASQSRIGWSPFSLQNNGAGPGLNITVDTTPQANWLAGHTPSNPLNLPYNTGIIVSATETNGIPTPGLFSFQYGLVEIQALLPGGPGMWVGFGMYPFTGSGELDIIETGGSHLTDVFSSIHSSTLGKSTTVPVTDYTKNRHIYGVNWQPDLITWYVDGNQTAQVPTPPDFVGKPYYIELDIAIQGNPGLGWDGVPDATTVFPQQMQIDFVRVSQGTSTGNTISAGQIVTFTGTLSGYTVAPSLTYAINNGQPIAMTGVTATGWNMAFNAPNQAGAYVINVTDGTTNGTISFQVGTAALVITPIAPNTPVAGQSFTFTGVLAGYTTIPALHYTINGGASTLLTGVSVTGWATTITIAAAGSYTIVVTDGTGTTGSVSFTVASPNTALRTWYQNPGMDGSFIVQPFYSSAAWITSGPLVTALRAGSPSINVKGNFAAPTVIGTASDPLVTVTDGTHSIVVHIPLGTIVEGPSAPFDQSIGGVDATQPYLVWSISGATCNTGAVAASGSVITGTYGFAVQDGAGLLLVDQVTGAPGDNNSIGGIQDFELAQIAANPSYVIPHMLTYQLDRTIQLASTGPIWPLKIIDTAGTNTGPIPQGYTIGIPANVARPSGKSRGFYALWDVFQQYGGFFYNAGGVGGVNISVYDQSGAFASLVADMQSSWPTVAQSLCLLNADPTVQGAQYSLATTKGAIPGATPAFPPPPPLDLSPTGGANVAPSTFGAWYPSGYNATPTNSTTTPTFTITPTPPTNVVINTAFTFTGTLAGYSTAPTLTYAVDGGTPQTLAGVTATGWSTAISIAASGTHTIVVADSAHGVSGGTTFNVSNGTAPPPSTVTWNPADLAGGIVLSNNNYTATATGSTTAGAVHQGVRATSAINATGLVLWEVTAAAINQDWASGVANATFGLTAGGGLGADNNGIGAYISTGTGSQPAQTVYYNGAQLTAGNGQSSVAPSTVTFCTNGTNLFFSDAAMRSTSGVQWNNSTTANPVTNTGGFPFAAIGATFYPCFNTLEGGASATLNDGTSPLSSFAAAFIAANPTVVTLSGQAPVVGAKTITPVTPSGVTVSTPFSFSGTLSGYTSTPNLVYSINGGASQALSSVTGSGWSTTLTIAAAGSYTITVTDGTVTGTTASFSVTTTGGVGTRVAAPLTGSVTAGTWTTLQSAPIATAPFNGKTMQYNILLPAQYNPNLVYPLLCVAHPDFDGMSGSVYKSGPAFVTATAYVNATQSLDSLFNNPTFRAAFPCIIFAPQCWQPGSDTVDNFGGYGDSQNSAGNEQGVNAIMASIIAGNVAGISAASVDPQKRLLVGYSLGAIGTLAWLIDNNQFNGPSGLKLWTAGIGMSDQLNRPGVSNSSLFSRMSGIPYMAISTTSDNSPTSWDEPAWTSYTGNSSYPSKANYDSGGMAAIRAGSSSFYYINYGSANPTAPFMLLNALGGDGAAMYTWLFSQLGPGGANITISGTSFTPAASVQANSAIGTVAGQLTVGSANGSLTGVTYTLSSTTNFKVTTSGQIQFNSASVPAGAYTLSVTVAASNASNSPQTSGFTVTVTSTTASGVFSINGSNGTVIAPDGTTWVGAGIALHDFDVTSWVTNANCTPLLTLFPGCNMVRIAAFSYWAPSTYAQAIGWLTAKKIVVVLEDHTNSTGQNSGGAVGVVYTGAQLTAELNWYSALATAFINNTYVWLGTDNEPSQSPSLSAMYTWQQQTYNAIRATGSQCIIEMETPNPFQQGARGGVANNIFSQMHNIVIGPHFYSWIWGGQSTNVPQATIYSSSVGSTNSQWGGIVQQIANLRFFSSLDGIIPVGCFEFGPSTTGLAPQDVSGVNCVNAVIQAVTAGNLFCFNAWAVNTSAGDLLNNGTSSLTTWGQTVASAITQLTATLPAGTAIRARDFTRTMAVQTKLENPSGPSSVASTVINALNYLNPNGVGTGISILREGFNAPPSSLNAVGNAGYKLDLFGNYGSPGSNSGSALIGGIQGYVNAGFVAVVEGPLEVDNQGFGLATHPSTASYTALNGTTYTGWQAAVKYQQDIWTSFNALSPTVALFTLANPGDGAANSPAVTAASQLGLNLTSITDFGNVHFYEHNGNSPITEMPGVIAQETGYTSGLPFMISETGFNDDTSGSAASQGYYGNPVVNGKYTLNLFFDAYKKGCRCTVYYELFDEAAAPPAAQVNPAFEGHWGLFDFSANPKPAATYLRNLLTIIGDAGSTASTFAPGGVGFTISGLGSNGNSLLMQKSDGTYELAIWVDANIFTNGVASTAPTQNVTVTVSHTTTFNEYDPTIGTAAIQTQTGVKTINVALTDHPIIIAFT